MKVPKKSFTVELDGPMLDQVSKRAMFTGRTRSQEICHLLARALERLPDDYEGWETNVDLPVRTSINLDMDLRNLIECRAVEIRVSTGKLVNMLLKFIIDQMTRDSQAIMDEVAQRGQALHSQ